MSKDLKLQQNLIKTANQIREKYRALKRGKFMLDEARVESFKPITEKLDVLATQPKQLKESRPELDIVPFNPVTPSPLKSYTPSRIPFINPRPTPPTLEFGKLAAKHLGNYLVSAKSSDTTYGIHKDPDTDTFKIGNKDVEIAQDDITVAGKKYKGTDGLWQLLTLKDPKGYSNSDLKNYKEILEKTSAHKKNYNPESAISSNKHSKYMTIIKPMFKSSPAVPRDSEEEDVPSGSGLFEHKKVITNNKIDYIYWNDINELVDRLRLLILSRDAGNTGVHNEIEAVLEELREAGIIE